MGDDKFLYAIGALIVANMASIGTVLYAAAKGVWFIAKLDSKVTENSKDVNSAFAKIRDLETSLRNQ